MYLVELRPGKEELYRSSDELALAIRNGDVDARSRVYHRATAKWISITLHPQYKAIVSAAKEETAARPLRRVWGILGGGGSEQPPASPDAPAPTSGPQLQYRWRRPLALGISALLLMSGVQLAFSGPVKKTEKTERTEKIERTEPTRDGDRETADAGAETASALVSLASNRTAWDDSAADSLEVDATEPKPVTSKLPRAPKLRSKSLREALAPGAIEEAEGSSVEALLTRYAAAYDAAQSRLEAGIRVARLNRLFAASRLGPDGGVSDTRMSLAGAANFIRVYRQQEAAIEQAYQDTVTSLARQQSWSPKKLRQWSSRPSRKEPPALELLSGSLLASIDSVLGVLNAQAGTYKIRGTAIAFEDPSAGQSYGALRRKIKEQIDAAVAAGAATSPGAAGLLLQAIGTTSLPRET